MSLLPVGFGASGDDYEITDSLRFRSSASAFLDRTNTATPTSTTVWTCSVWVKRGTLGTNQYILNAGPFNSGNNFEGFYFMSNDTLRVQLTVGNSQISDYRTNAVFRDASAWYHFVIVRNGQAYVVYVNGVAQTFGTSTFGSNPSSWVNAATPHEIGNRLDGLQDFDGYITEFNCIDGQALDADDFGAYDANGTWKAKEYTGTYGTNGFYLPMKPTTQAELQNTVLYTGTGASQSIDGVGFSPDLVWLKSRDAAYSNALFDSVRGISKWLTSNGTNAEATVSGVTSFDSDGFTLGSDTGQNNSGTKYVAWGWDAGDNQPSTGHSSITWTGNGNVGTREFSGFGFSPDLVWIKGRTYAGSHQLYDTVRGASKKLFSNGTSAENTTNTYGILSSFTNNGFIATQGTSDFQEINNAGSTFVAWGWDAGDGDPVSNTTGDINSTVKANDATGFSVVSYTGNGSSNQTVGHGLSSDINMVIVKNRSSTAAWRVWHSSLSGDTYYLNLDGSFAESSSSTVFNGHSNTTFTVGNDASVNSNGSNYIAYCFSEVSGVSKFGSYTGNGSSNGPTVTGLGFRPGFVLVKAISTGQGWTIWDSTRGPFNTITESLSPNASSTESNFYTVDFNDDGFQLKSSFSVTNQNGQTYMYMAFKGSYSDHVSPLNDTGTIDSRVKANPDKGFSIVSYEGTGGATDTIGHGLSSTPEMVIVKDRDAGNFWSVYHVGVDATAPEDYLMRLNTTDARLNGSVYWNDTAPTSSVFTVGTSSALNDTHDYIAYCFHSVAGYSKFDSYTGTGSAGNSVTGLGFQPAWLMVKRTNSTGNWFILDSTRNPSNSADSSLAGNSSSAEVSPNSSVAVDFDSDGFTIQSTGNGINASSSTYIYMAFADTADARFNFDASGNKNNWLPNNINSNAESETTYDLMKDTPSLVDENAANFATLNPLDVYPGRQFAVDANLKWNDTSGGSWGRSTVSVTTGKWYWEVSGFTTTNWFIGVSDGTKSITNYYAYYVGAPTALVYLINGNTYIAGANAAFISPIATTAVVGFVVDADAGSLAVYKNGALQGTITGLNYGSYSPMVAPPAVGSCVYNFGQRPFAYTPPTGSKKLNTFNLPDSTIEDGSDYFNTVLYTGDGTSSNAITGVGFQPDLVVGKGRTYAGSGFVWYDAVRGATKWIGSYSTAAEATVTGVTSFDADGFSVGSSAVQNLNAYPYVAWNWLANGSGVSNTDGSITSTVSANTEAGFSIVSYTGTNSNATVGHGLGVAPSMVICKNRTTGIGSGSWPVWHTGLSSGSSYMFLNSTSAQASGNNNFTAAPTSTVLNLGTSDTNNTATMIAYCFAEVEGYSAFGSYTGNGSADGTFVYTGFRPAWILIKQTNGSSFNWNLIDTSRSPFNTADDLLAPNATNAEVVSGFVDAVSNGFKCRNSSAYVNGSGSTYIYMAFAENPFKNANAR